MFKKCMLFVLVVGLLFFVAPLSAFGENFVKVISIDLKGVRSIIEKKEVKAGDILRTSPHWSGYLCDFDKSIVSYSQGSKGDLLVCVYTGKIREFK